MNSFAISGADSSDRALWLKGLTKRNSKDGLSFRIHRSPGTITPVLNHSKLFKKLFRVFVSSGEFPTSDGGDLTGKRRLFYASGRFTILHFHMSVSSSKGPTSFHYFDSSDLTKDHLFSVTRPGFLILINLRFDVSVSGSQGPLASCQCTHTEVWMTYVSSSCWQTHFSSFVTLSGICTRNSFRWASCVLPYFKFSPTFEKAATVKAAKQFSNGLKQRNTSCELESCLPASLQHVSSHQGGFFSWYWTHTHDSWGKKHIVYLLNSFIQPFQWRVNWEKDRSPIGRQKAKFKLS